MEFNKEIEPPKRRTQTEMNIELKSSITQFENVKDKLTNGKLSRK